MKRVDSVADVQNLDANTFAWRMSVLLLLAATVPVGWYWSEIRQKTDTEAMLNVSVSIKTISHVKIDSLGDSVWSPASGSGLLSDSNECEVLTNHHVIADAARIEVYPRKWTDSVGIPATVVNSNPRADIAVLRMAHCEGIPEARFGDSDTLHPGDDVFAVGNPLGGNPDSISRGIVSHTERFTAALIPYIQTDATISHGSSGGALFNKRGEVVGINTAIAAAPNGNSVGVGYALPINQVKNEATALRTGPPSWGQVGIEDALAGLTRREAAFFGVPDGLAAVMITRTPENGPVKDRLFAKDVIYAIGETALTGVKHAQRLIGSYEPGDDISFSIMRSGEPVEVEVVVVEGWEERESEPADADFYAGHLGLTLEMWDSDDAGHRFDSPVITLVHSLGPAHLAHVTSSQKTIVRNGPLMMPIQLYVNTIKGIVFNGAHRTVNSIESVERLSAEAFDVGTPLLLEIETWGRENPLDLDQPMVHQKTRFHTLVPALTTAEAPPASDGDAEVGMNSGGPPVNEVAYFETERR